MKYMGSKRWMLTNGLGKLLLELAPKARSFHDVFSGSSAVSHFVATRIPVRVCSSDLQLFAVVIADSILLRRQPVDGIAIWRNWLKRAMNRYQAFQPPVKQVEIADFVRISRVWAAGQDSLPITNAYGGHYFSPVQACQIDCLRASLPKDPAERALALSALIQAASRCAAAPGHTAQPFQPTPGASKYLAGAWAKSLLSETRRILIETSERHALVTGEALKNDAVRSLERAVAGDVAFLDPPYSGVHYSRFYHVLETIAAGSCGPVSGVGRYPDVALRPRSDYSVKSAAQSAMEVLLSEAARRSVTVVLTFPDHKCSNGLSGDILRQIAQRDFKLREKVVESKFSTLGGTSSGDGSAGSRAARVKANELILVLSPR